MDIGGKTRIDLRAEIVDVSEINEVIDVDDRSLRISVIQHLRLAADRSLSIHKPRLYILWNMYICQWNH